MLLRSCNCVYTHDGSRPAGVDTAGKLVKVLIPSHGRILVLQSWPRPISVSLKHYLPPHAIAQLDYG